MGHLNTGLHHFHKRKRIYKNFEPYPHPSRWKSLMDRIIYVVAFAGPVMTVPQVLQIFLDKNASGISVISWITYTITSTFWLIYGILHKDKPIAISSIAWIILEIFIIAGTILFG